LTLLPARPVANSTTDGIPTPTAAARSLRTESTPATISSTSPSELVTSVGLTSESLSRPPSSVATATFVPPTSTPISWPSSTAPIYLARSPFTGKRHCCHHARPKGGP
jgi:hypothetical protein